MQKHHFGRARALLGLLSTTTLLALWGTPACSDSDESSVGSKPCTSNEDCEVGICGSNRVCTMGNNPPIGNTGGNSSIPIAGSPGSSGSTGNPSGGGGGVTSCSGSEYEQREAGGPLDIYFIFDRTGSMGDDCEYQPGGTPPVNSKACFATYALVDYLTTVSPMVDTRLAFQFMSLEEDDCDGVPYSTPAIDLLTLPVAQDSALVTEIVDENFEGGIGTHIEGALRGIANYTQNNVTDGREMIGVLMTDGDPQGCNQNVEELADIVENHRAATGLRTFVIGMEGAQNDTLEALAEPGGADPHDDWCEGGPTPCHYWNVGDGSGAAIEEALQAILMQAVPLPCDYDVGGFQPPAGEVLDFGRVNVTLTENNGVPETIGQVAQEDDCPTDEPAWYYDNPAAPSSIHLCSNACDLVTASANGSRVSVVVGCQGTVIIPPPE